MSFFFLSVPYLLCFISLILFLPRYIRFTHNIIFFQHLTCCSFFSPSNIFLGFALYLSRFYACLIFLSNFFALHRVAILICSGVCVYQISAFDVCHFYSFHVFTPPLICLTLINTYKYSNKHSPLKIAFQIYFSNTLHIFLSF